MQINMKTV